MFAKLKRKIKCPDTLRLIRLIIDGSNEQDEVNTYFPGDDLFTPFERRRGIPIGNVPVTEGVDHLGYRIFPTHRRLRRDNIWRFLRKMRQMQRLYAEGKIALEEINVSLQSWLGHARHADTQGLRTKIFDGICFAKRDHT